MVDPCSNAVTTRGSTSELRATVGVQFAIARIVAVDEQPLRTGLAAAQRANGLGHQRFPNAHPSPDAALGRVVEQHLVTGQPHLLAQQCGDAARSVLLRVFLTADP